MAVTPFSFPKAKGSSTENLDATVAQGKRLKFQSDPTIFRADGERLSGHFVAAHPRCPNRSGATRALVTGSFADDESQPEAIKTIADGNTYTIGQPVSPLGQPVGGKRLEDLDQATV